MGSWVLGVQAATTTQVAAGSLGGKVEALFVDEGDRVEAVVTLSEPADHPHHRAVGPQLIAVERVSRVGGRQVDCETLAEPLQADQGLALLARRVLEAANHSRIVGTGKADTKPDGTVFEFPGEVLADARKRVALRLAESADVCLPERDVHVAERKGPGRERHVDDARIVEQLQIGVLDEQATVDAFEVQAVDVLGGPFPAGKQAHVLLGRQQVAGLIRDVRRHHQDRPVGLVDPVSLPGIQQGVAIRVRAHCGRRLG